MFNRNILFLAISLVVPSAIYADKPTTPAGKFGASILQTINKYPFISSYALAACLFSKKEHYVHFLVACIAGGLLTETISKALMNNFNIDPITQ